MPELPEVEAARQTAEEYLVNKTIVEANAVEDEKIFAGASPESLRSALVGKTVTAARRHGKNLWLELEQGGGGGGGGQKEKKAPRASASSSSSSPPSSSPSSAALMLHFGMTGSFPVRGAKRVVYVNEGGSAKKGGKKEAGEEEDDDEEEATAGKASSPAQWPPRFCKLELSLSPGDVRVAYCDPRRFGRVQLVRPAAAVKQRLPSGRDILNDPLSPRDLTAELAKFNKGKAGRALKTVLMEQSFLAGVGNWVADEVLFAARIHPETRSGQLSEQQVSRLAAALRGVAETACAARADAALFPREWIFHQRWDERAHSATSEGHAIRWIKVGGRTTAFCPGIQKKTDNGGGEEDGEEEEEETKPKPKSKAAATLTSKRKQPPPPPTKAAAAALPPAPKAGKRAKRAVAVPKKAPSSRAAAPSARARALPPRI